eukprot:TRINITY_DN35376_c0_g1_i2.p1 TRINITY_DN35376_c0_g1~~TRINITY_DN35376_c0_g1_i2.p1  ORF type:complete len:413 (-),score=77.73 TRINITY_DN35376_c0_g1_i2:296-1534(-)
MHLALEAGHAEIVEALIEKPKPLLQVRLEELLDEHLLGASSPKLSLPIRNHRTRSRGESSDGAESEGGESQSSRSSRMSKSSRMSRASKASALSKTSKVSKGSAAKPPSVSSKTSSKSPTLNRSKTIPAKLGSEIDSKSSSRPSSPSSPQGGSSVGSRPKSAPKGKAKGKATAKKASGKSLARAQTQAVAATLLGEEECPTIVEDDWSLLPEEAASAGRFGLFALARKMREVIATSLPEYDNLELVRNPDRMGRPPLCIALANGHSHLLPVLLEWKAQIDSQDPNGNTALMMAAAQGRLPEVQALVEKGADVSVRNSEGQRAIDLASTKAIRLALIPQTVRRLAGLARPSSASATLKPLPKLRPSAEEQGLNGRQRLRLEGLPTQLPQDLLEGHVRALLRRLHVANPDFFED